MDRVFIEDLRIDTVIGIYDWERRTRQTIALDVEMGFDNCKPAASDAIEDTLDYKAVSKRLIAFVEGSSFQLVETLAERCAALIREEFGVPWVRLKLAKPGAVRGARAVGVVIERGSKVWLHNVHRAYLSLGSNIDPEAHLRAAIEQLRARFGEIVVSPVYRSRAVGFDGPDFLNLAVAIDTELDPVALDVWLHDLENRRGRRRDVPRYASRTLDVDIVLFDDLVVDGPGHLRIPRPELKEAFVLRPLSDIASGVRDPLSGKTVAELWGATGQAPPMERVEWDGQPT